MQAVSFNIIFTLIFEVTFGLGVAGLSCFHGYLIGANLSTIEMYDTHTRNWYSRGCKSNCIQLCGTSRLRYFLPLDPVGRDCEGTAFPLQELPPVNTAPS